MTPAHDSSARPAATRHGVLAGGNFIVDCVKLIDQWPPQDSLARIRSQALHNGGGPYNILKNLSRLGADYPLTAIGRVGADPHGAHILADCANHRIDTTQLVALPDAATSYTDVMTVAETGRRTFFYQPGANTRLKASDFDFGSRPHRLFYLGYLLLLDQLDSPGDDGRPAAADVLARARAAGLCTAVDCVSENSDRFRTVVAPTLHEVDLLFVNDFEAGKLTGLTLVGDEVNREDFALAARQLLTLGVQELVVIHSPAGVFAATRGGEEHWQPSVMVPQTLIAGAAGAGDAVAAGVIYGWHERWPLARSLELGVCAAAASLRHAGCSEAIESVDRCLQFGHHHGFRSR